MRLALALTAAYALASGILTYVQAEARTREATAAVVEAQKIVEQCRVDAATARGELRAFQWAMKCAKRGECDEIVAQ